MDARQAARDKAAADDAICLLITLRESLLKMGHSPDGRIISEIDRTLYRHRV